MAHCVISVIVDSDDGNSIIPACVVHDDSRIPDPLDHVFEDEILPCPCGTEVLAAVEVTA